MRVLTLLHTFFGSYSSKVGRARQTHIHAVFRGEIICLLKQSKEGRRKRGVQRGYRDYRIKGEVRILNRPYATPGSPWLRPSLIGHKGKAGGVCWGYTRRTPTKERNERYGSAWANEASL